MIQTVKVLAGRGINGKYKVEVDPSAQSNFKEVDGEKIYLLKNDKFSSLDYFIKDINIAESTDTLFNEMRVLLGEGVVVNSTNATIPTGDFKLFITQKDGKQGLDFEQEFEDINEKLDDLYYKIDNVQESLNKLDSAIFSLSSIIATVKEEQKVVKAFNEGKLSQEDLDDLELLKKL